MVGTSWIGPKNKGTSRAQQVGGRGPRCGLSCVRVSSQMTPTYRMLSGDGVGQTRSEEFGHVQP